MREVGIFCILSAWMRLLEVVNLGVKETGVILLIEPLLSIILVRMFDRTELLSRHSTFSVISFI